MKHKSLVFSGWVAALFLAVMAGCASEKEPAQRAIATAQAAIESIGGEAAKYVPQQWQDLQNSMAAVQADFDKGDYKATLTGATALLDKTKAVTAAAEAKKQEKVAELTQEWNTLSGSIQPMVDAIQAKIDTLSKAKKLPKNITQSTLDSAKSGLETVKQNWADASASFTGGQVEGGINKAHRVQARAQDLMTQLGLSSGG